MLFLCSAEGRFFVPACRSTCKKDTSAVLGQACPGSEQEGPARVAQCPHERRSGARGRCLFAHRAKPGWHSGAVLEAPALVSGLDNFVVTCVDRAATKIPMTARMKSMISSMPGSRMRPVPREPQPQCSSHQER